MPLPTPPSYAHWLTDPQWGVTHLVNATGRSLCGKVATDRDTQPARPGAKPCRSCLHAAGIDE
jgi:hypothetical protein